MKWPTYLGMAGLVLLAACHSQPKDRSSTLEEKKREVEKLRQELLKLQSRIAELEEAIRREDTTYGSGKAVSVSYVVLEPKPFSAYLQFQGSVDNRQVVTLTAKAPATISRIYVQEGQRVAAGQLLLEQEGEVLRKNLQEVRTRLELARTLYEKQKKLYEEGIGSEVQYLTAKNNKEALEATVATLEEQLRNLQIRAPFAGQIDAVLVRVGELLSPGVPAIRLVSAGQWEVKVEVPEGYAQLARPGGKVEIFVPDLNLTFPSRIAAVGESISPLSRTFTVVVRDIPAASVRQLRPGMVAYVRLPERDLPRALVVPAEALQAQDEANYVYLYKGGVARRQRVRVLSLRGGEAAVEGLQPGDTVITVGAALLSEGQRVALTTLE